MNEIVDPTRTPASLFRIPRTGSAVTKSSANTTALITMVANRNVTRNAIISITSLHTPQMSLPQASDKLHCYYFPEEDS